MEPRDHPGGIACDQVLDFICEQFGEDDDSARCLAVKAHLALCPDCTTYCNSIDKMIGLYRAASPEFPEHARGVLLHALGIPSSSEEQQKPR